MGNVFLENSVNGRGGKENNVGAEVVTAVVSCSVGAVVTISVDSVVASAVDSVVVSLAEREADSLVDDVIETSATTGELSLPQLANKTVAKINKADMRVIIFFIFITFLLG